MGIIITAVLGVFLACLLCYMAYDKHIDSLENPDWMDRTETIIKQIALAGAVFVAEFFMFLLAEENSVIVRNTSNTPEFVRALGMGLFYLAIMVGIGKIYAHLSGLHRD
jgi:glycerol uptake facilitator-like aquaporin